MIMTLCMEQYVLKLYKVYINDDPELTLTHFKTMSNLAKLRKARISVERLQDHCSSGFYYKPMGIFPDAHGQQTPQSLVRSGRISNSSEML